MTGVPDYKYINPLYVKLNGKPIIFTILCPVVTGYDSIIDGVKHEKYDIIQVQLKP